MYMYVGITWNVCVCMQNVCMDLASGMMYVRVWFHGAMIHINTHISHHAYDSSPKSLPQKVRMYMYVGITWNVSCFGRCLENIFTYIHTHTCIHTYIVVPNSLYHTRGTLFQ